MTEGKVQHPMLGTLQPRIKRSKIVSVEEAVQLVKNGNVVATEGFVGTGFAEEVATALEERFIKTGEPRDLTLVYAAGQGDGKEKGLNHLGHEGMVKRIIGGHWGLAPKLQKLAFTNKIEAYNLPQGVVSHMFRDIAAKRPRTISRVGLYTFVDPRNGGGKINNRTTEDIVEVVTFDGKEYLAYKTFPIDIALLRGTTGDVDGNISMEKEALFLETLAIAMAVRNSRGVVIVQVERIAERGTLNAKNVKIPGILVDCVVQVKDPENHWQTFAVKYDPSLSGEIKAPLSSFPPMELDERKIIARRAAMELKTNDIVNLGIGMPEGVAAVAAEEQILEYISLTAEAGVIGGIPTGGLSFGAAMNTDAIIDQPYQFDFYDGGGLDITFLGLAQADREGNLNVSKFGPRLAGAGGFINISQNAKKVIFVGTFTTSGLEVRVENGKLKIIREGAVKKFVEKVDHLTFSARFALETGKPVLYITERCVFTLNGEGLRLMEVAPGVDIEKDIIAHMDFRPVVKGIPVEMDARIFQTEPMNLKEDLLGIPLEDRFIYDAESNIFYVNFEGLAVRSYNLIDEIHRHATAILESVGKKVYAIINYDNFAINQDLIDRYTEIVEKIISAYYIKVTRYTSNAFCRMLLGRALEEKKICADMYATKEQAVMALR